MSLDQELRSTLDRESERCQVPELDLTAVLERGRAGARRRSHHRGLLVVAAILAVVFCLGVLPLVFRDGTAHQPRPSQQPSERPTTVEDLPVGAPPAIPYCKDGDQILGAGAPISSRCEPFVHRGNATLGLGENGIDWVGDGRITRLDPRLPDVWYPALSQDGRYAAWLTPATGESDNLLVYDTDSRTKLAEVAIPSKDAWVPGIDDLGRVYVFGFDSQRTLMWMYDIAETRLVPVRGVPKVRGASVNYVTADGVGFWHSSFWLSGEETSWSNEGTVTPDGRFVSRGLVPIGWSFWSPDRTRLVQETSDGFWVQRISELDDPVRLRLPTVGRAVGSPVWETDDTLLVTFDPELAPGLSVTNDNPGSSPPTDRSWTLRCSADTGDCEAALPAGQTGPGLRGALYR